MISAPHIARRTGPYSVGAPGPLELPGRAPEPARAGQVEGEFGDDRRRYADGKARRDYAATSPITRGSGTTTA